MPLSMSSFMSRHLPQNLAGGVASRDAHDATAWMATGSAQEQSNQWRAVLRGAGHGPHHQELIEGQVAMMPMAAVYTKFALDVARCQQFCAEDRRPQSRCVSLERGNRDVGKGLVLAVPAAPEGIGLPPAGSMVMPRGRGI